MSHFPHNNRDGAEHPWKGNSSPAAKCDLTAQRKQKSSFSSFVCFVTSQKLHQVLLLDLREKSRDSETAEYTRTVPRCPRPVPKQILELSNSSARRLREVGTFGGVELLAGAQNLCRGLQFIKVPPANSVALDFISFHFISFHFIPFHSPQTLEWHQPLWLVPWLSGCCWVLLSWFLCLLGHSGRFLMCQKIPNQESVKVLVLAHATSPDHSEFHQSWPYFMSQAAKLPTISVHKPQRGGSGGCRAPLPSCVNKHSL